MIKYSPYNFHTTNVFVKLEVVNSHMNYICTDSAGQVERGGGIDPDRTRSDEYATEDA